MHDPDSAFDGDAPAPDGAGEHASSMPVPAGASTPAAQGERGLDMYERDMLETVSRFVEATGLGYHLGAAVERILHAPGQGREGGRTLREAMWLLERHIEIVERRPVGADLHVVSERLARTGDVIAELKALAAEPAGTVEPPVPADAGIGVEAAAPGEPRATPETEVPQDLDDIIIIRDEPTREQPVAVGDAPPLPLGRDTGAAVAAPMRVTGLSFSAEPVAAEAEESEEHYPLHRELAVMAFRWALMVVAVIAIVLVATLIAGWR